MKNEKKRKEKEKKKHGLGHIGLFLKKKREKVWKLKEKLFSVIEIITFWYILTIFKEKKIFKKY